MLCLILVVWEELLILDIAIAEYIFIISMMSFNVLSLRQSTRYKKAKLLDSVSLIIDFFHFWSLVNSV